MGAELDGTSRNWVLAGMEVRVVGAVYSEVQRIPKKAKMQEDHHNCLSLLE